MVMRGGDHRVDTEARSIQFNKAKNCRNNLGKKLEGWARTKTTPA